MRTESERRPLDTSVSNRPAAPAGRTADRDDEARARTDPLHDLTNSIRVELELDRKGAWLGALCERASDRAAEISLRSAVWRGFSTPCVGARIRLLVVPASGEAFSVYGRVVPARQPGSTGGAFTVGLALDTNDAVVLVRWQAAVALAR
jgi:hypothetical protein